MSLVQKWERCMEQSDKERRPIRVLIIDRSILTLQGIKDFFSRSHHIEIIGMAGTRQEALHAIHAEQPDLVLVEAQVGQDSGIELCKTIRQLHPPVRKMCRCFPIAWKFSASTSRCPEVSRQRHAQPHLRDYSAFVADE